jgi:hypothetical protein
MRNKIQLVEKLTLEKFGYDSSLLSPGSHHKVVVKCFGCNEIFLREYRYIQKLHQCKSVIGNTKHCFKCKIWKKLEEFPKNKNTSGNVGKLCKNCFNSHPSVIKCEKKRLKAYKTLFYTNIEKYITKRCYAIKKQAKIKNVNFNLTPKYLINLWNAQNGDCFYTKIKMVSSGKYMGFQRWDAPSIDRLNPKKGYIIKNVVWCCFGVNSFKNALDINQFEEKIKNIKWWYEK